MKKSTYRSAMAAFSLGLMLFFGSGSAYALNLVTNGGFETGDFTGWVKSGSYMYVNGSNPFSGSFAATLGTPGALGSLTQTIATLPGYEYELSFALATSGGAPSEFHALVNGTSLFSLTNEGNHPYEGVSLFFTAGASPTQIAFLARNDVGSFFLDNVSVDLAPVPEPSTLLLLGIGLLGAGFLRKRTQRKAAALT